MNTEEPEMTPEQVEEAAKQQDADAGKSFLEAAREHAEAKKESR